jgi:hypothetical protein
MTKDEFDKIEFHSQIMCIYKGKLFKIIAVDFDEYLIGIDEYDQDIISFKRCENISLLNGKTHDSF